MTASRDPLHLPTGFDLVESILLSLSGIAVGAFTLPGLTLCVPGIAFLAVVVIAPLVALAALAALVGAVLALPYLLMRSVGAIRSRRAAALAVRRSPFLAKGMESRAALPTAPEAGSSGAARKAARVVAGRPGR